MSLYYGKTFSQIYYDDLMNTEKEGEEMIISNVSNGSGSTWTFNDMLTQTALASGNFEFVFHMLPQPERIIRNENATVVMWKDGTKTVVHKAEGTEDSPYAAFTAALAIKCYGSNSAVNRIVRKTEQQKSKKEKAKEKKRKKTLSQLTEEVTINLVQMKCENCKYIDKACATEYKKGEAYFCEHKGKYVFPDKYCTDFEPEML